MKNASPFRLLAFALITLASFTTAEASQGSTRRARDMVRRAEAQQEQLLAQAPRLGEVDAAIRADCAEKNANVASDSAFCSCASAVIMMLWRSGADPQMVPRLLDFANGRGEATAQTFLAYQGPELYRPICSMAGQR